MSVNRLAWAENFSLTDAYEDNLAIVRCGRCTWCVPEAIQNENMREVILAMYEHWKDAHIDWGSGCTCHQP